MHLRDVLLAALGVLVMVALMLLVGALAVAGVGDVFLSPLYVVRDVRPVALPGRG